MTEFCVKINRTIRNATHMVCSDKQINLPFAPFVGLKILNADGQEEEYELQKVAWDCVNQRFDVVAVDETSSCETHLILAEEIEHGWDALAFNL